MTRQLAQALSQRIDENKVLKILLKLYKIQNSFNKFRVFKVLYLMKSILRKSITSALISVKKETVTNNMIKTYTE